MPTYNANWTADLQGKGSEGAFIMNKSYNDKIAKTKKKIITEAFWPRRKTKCEIISKNFSS